MTQYVQFIYNLQCCLKIKMKLDSEKVKVKAMINKKDGGLIAKDGKGGH